MAVMKIMKAATGLSLVMLASFMTNTPAWGQLPDDPHDATRAQGYSSLELLEFSDFVARSRDFIERTPAYPATISKDVLMHPLSAKARRRLVKALHLAKLGEHPARDQGVAQNVAQGAFLGALCAESSGCGVCPQPTIRRSAELV